MASPFLYARVGIVVPRFNKSAVDRNRVKRRLRELVRRDLLPSLPAQDVLIRATPLTYRATFDAMRGAMQQIARKLGPSP
jgi:ribonuclease P protein component